MAGNINRIALQENQTVIVRAAGDVFLRGWDEADLEAICDDGRLAFTTQAESNTLYVVAKNDMLLSVPRGQAVRVEHISGDGLVSGMLGALEVLKVSGDLMVEKCANVDLRTVGGDLYIREISGKASAQKVGGDLQGRGLSGGLQAENIGGCASFSVGSGPLNLRAGGDISISILAGGSDEINLKAGGDIEVYISPESGLSLELSANGEDIDIEVGGRSWHIEDSHFTTQVGEGGRRLVARAGGDIRVSDDEWDEEDLDDEFTDLMEDWEDWENDFAEEREDLGHIEERVRRQVEESSRRAEERVRQAMERVERQNQRRQDIFSRFGERWGNYVGKMPSIPPIEIPSIPAIPAIPPIPPIPPVPPIPPIPPIQRPGEGAVNPLGEENTGVKGPSNEERMLVLKMLREHKITVEEAEELLRALDGKAD